MATRPMRTSAAQAVPFNLFAQAVPLLSRHELAALTERLIDYLDALDGDPDLEEDDHFGVNDEDGINTMFGRVSGLGPGCPLSDNVG